MQTILCSLSESLCDPGSAKQMLLPKNLSLEELTQGCGEEPRKTVECLNIYPQETKVDVIEFPSTCKFKFSTIGRILP